MQRTINFNEATSLEWLHSNKHLIITTLKHPHPKQNQWVILLINVPASFEILSKSEVAMGIYQLLLDIQFNSELYLPFMHHLTHLLPQKEIMWLVHKFTSPEYLRGVYYSSLGHPQELNHSIGSTLIRFILEKNVEVTEYLFNLPSYTFPKIFGCSINLDKDIHIFDKTFCGRLSNKTRITANFSSCKKSINSIYCDAEYIYCDGQLSLLGCQLSITNFQFTSNRYCLICDCPPTMGFDLVEMIIEKLRDLIAIIKN